MNQLEVLLLPPGRNASPLQGHLPVIHQASLTIFCYPFILLGTERHCERKMFCPRTQHFDCARSQTWTSQPAVQCCDCYKPNTGSHTHRPSKRARIGALSHKQPSLKKVNTSLQKTGLMLPYLPISFSPFPKLFTTKFRATKTSTRTINANEAEKIWECKTTCTSGGCVTPFFTFRQPKKRMPKLIIDSYTPRFRLLILSSSCYTCPCKLIVSIWC